MFKLYLKQNSKKGFTLMELLVVMAIGIALFAISINVFSNLRNKESLDSVSALVVEVLRQAKHATIESKNSNQYGVYFNTSNIVLYIGPTYIPGSPTNEVYNFSSDVRLYSISINGGGNAVLFDRITGDTINNGTIVLRSETSSTTKSITIYKTGLIEQ